MLNKISILTLIMILTLLSNSVARAGESVKLANGEWKPFTSAELVHYGIFSHITELAFKAVGLETENDFFPWKRSLLVVEKGRYDATMGWALTPLREKNFYVSAPFYRGEYVFFHLQDTDFNWQNMTDLEGVKIGVTIGSIDAELFTAMHQQGKNIHYETAPRVELNFKKLLKGRISVFVTQKDVGLATLNDHFTASERKRVTFHAKVLRRVDLHGLFSKQNDRGEAYLQAFNKGLKIIKEQGLYQKMIDDFQRGLYQP